MALYAVISFAVLSAFSFSVYFTKELSPLLFVLLVTLVSTIADVLY